MSFGDWYGWADETSRGERLVDAELKSVHEHMLRLALGALAHANWHAHFKSWDNDCWAELSVLQAAHAGEIFLKARIAPKSIRC